MVKTCGDAGRIDRLDAQQYALIIGAAGRSVKTSDGCSEPTFHSQFTLMDWTKIVQVLGGTAIVVAGLVYLAKKLFEFALQTAASDRESEARNRFALGATSHMANTAFDKHVEFCEEYAAEMNDTVTILFSEGPTKKALEHAGKLVDIRVKWNLWLTPELETNLGRFEGVIREIGAKAWLIDQIHGDDSRPAVVKEMYTQFAEAMGLEKWDDKPVSQELAFTKVKDKLREILGIKELTVLRSEFIKRAL